MRIFFSMIVLLFHHSAALNTTRALQNGTQSNATLGNVTSEYNGTNVTTTAAASGITTVHTTAPPLLNPDCDFNRGWCNWENAIDDEFDWLRKKGPTPSSSTGPEGDVSGQGLYTYIEASWPRRAGQVARLVSPVLTGTQCMRFHYNMNGRYMGDLQVFIKDKLSMIFVWGRYKNQGRKWHSTNVTVYGEYYKVLFFARVGKSYTGDLAIDNITFVNGTCDGKPLFYQARQVQHLTTKQEEGEIGTCNFDGGFCEWINVPLGDTFDWSINSGDTATLDTGPRQDHTGRNGYYLYVESSSPQTRKHRAQLLSPRICGTLCLQFYYHMYGNNVGQLNIYQRRGLGTDDRVWSVAGGQGDRWKEALVDINGNCYQIVIEGIIGNGYLGDSAIDDVVFTKGNCCSKRHIKFNVKRKGNCSFDKGLCKWKNIKDDDFDWSLTDRATPSTKTGPDAPFNNIGQYAFIEASEPRLSGDKAILVGPVLRGFVCMKFKYHMYGQHVGSLSVFKHGSGVFRHRLWHRKGERGNFWRDATINIQCRDTFYQIEIEAEIKGWRSDIAIDEISFSHDPCNKTVDLPIPPRSTRRPTYRSPTDGDCTFPQTFCDWKNDRDDNFDWQIGRGGTPTFKTGPKRDVDGNGYYIYMETSILQSRQRARLISGLMTGSQCMTFHYHMNGRGVGALILQKIDISSDHQRTVWFRSGHQGENWIRAHLNVEGAEYKIALVAEVGGKVTGDIAVDDISFTDGECKYLLETILDDVLPVDTPTVPFVPFEGFYIYIEATAPRKARDNAIISLSRKGPTCCMRFFYYMYGDEVGGLYVIEHVRSVRRRTIWVKEGPQGNRWKEGSATIIGSVGSYQVLIEATIGDDFRGDTALDDITFADGPCTTPTPKPTAVSTASSAPIAVLGDCANC